MSASDFAPRPDAAGAPGSAPVSDDLDSLPPAPLSDRVLAAAASPFGSLDGEAQLTLSGFDLPPAPRPTRGAGATAAPTMAGSGMGTSSPSFGTMDASPAAATAAPAPVAPPAVTAPVLDPAEMLRQRGEQAVSPAKRVWLRRVGGLAAALAITFGATQFFSGDSGQPDAPASGYAPQAPAAMANSFMPFLQVASASAQFAQAGQGGGVAGQPAVFQQGAREGSAVLHAHLLEQLRDPEARVAVFVSAANLATQTGDQVRMAALARIGEQLPEAQRADWRMHMSMEELYHRLADAALASRQDSALAVRFTQRAEAAGQLAQKRASKVQGQGWTEQTLREINDAVKGARAAVPANQPALFVSGYQRAIDESVQRVLILSGLEVESGRTGPLMTAQETVKASEQGKGRRLQ